MKALFKQYYSLYEDDLNVLWKDAVFIIDANSLLNLYRFNKDTSDSMLEVIDSVKDRLWIPFQVALEYQENRKFVVADQLAAFNKVNSVFDETLNYLNKKLQHLQLDKRHSTINPSIIVKQVKEKLSEVERYIQAVEEFSDIEENSKAIRDQIDELINPKIIGEPVKEAELNKIIEEGKLRYEKLIPPGFCDMDKPQDAYYVYDNVKYLRKYGDLILWKEILKYSNEKNIKNIIFITDDRKKDWWWIKSGEIIGPHKQLIEEIYSETKVERFWMYNTYSFLKNAEQYLKAKIEKEVFVDVRDVITRKKDNIRSGKLERLESQEYYIPILSVLHESDDGSLSVQECIDLIQPLLSDKFLPDDLRPLPGTGNIRWITNAKFARNDLRRFGYISNDSDRGIWEITDVGIKFLEENIG